MSMSMNRNPFLDWLFDTPYLSPAFPVPRHMRRLAESIDVDVIGVVLLFSSMENSIATQ